MDVKSLCNNESQQDLPPRAPKPQYASDKDSWQIFKYTVAQLQHKEFRLLEILVSAKHEKWKELIAFLAHKKMYPHLEQDTLWSNINIVTAGV